VENSTSSGADVLALADGCPDVDAVAPDVVAELATEGLLVGCPELQPAAATAATRVTTTNRPKDFTAPSATDRRNPLARPSGDFFISIQA
jgi:hypothetical protein